MTMVSLELTSAVTVVANALACKLTPDEIALLSVAFVQLGDTLATIATANNICKTDTDNQQKNN